MGSGVVAAVKTVVATFRAIAWAFYVEPPGC
jgi:hypothetical protein